MTIRERYHLLPMKDRADYLLRLTRLTAGAVLLPIRPALANPKKQTILANIGLDWAELVNPLTEPEHDSSCN